MKIKGIMWSVLVWFSAMQFVSCNTLEIDVASKVAADQDIYFQVVHTNFAWGKQFNGFVVDGEGNIHKFDMPDKWEVSDEKGVLTSDQVKFNLTQTTKSKVSVGTAELDKMVDKIRKIKSENLTKPISGGADMGQTVYYAYFFEAVLGEYHAIKLADVGDWKSYNKDASAIELTKWLEEISLKVRQDK